MKFCFKLPEGDVYHDHFKSLLGYEEDQAGLRAVPKLTKAHIMPNAFQKMSVRLAVQASNIMTFSCAAGSMFGKLLLQPHLTDFLSSVVQ